MYWQDVRPVSYTHLDVYKRQMQASGYPLQVQILHTYCVIVFCKAVAELMLEILPLVLYLFMI